MSVLSLEEVRKLRPAIDDARGKVSAEVLDSLEKLYETAEGLHAQIDGLNLNYRVLRDKVHRGINVINDALPWEPRL
jgi:hypothetical protein